MKTYLVPISFLFFLHISIAQNITDSLFFFSSQEQMFFENYQNENAFDLLYLIDVDESQAGLVTKHKAAFFDYLEGLQQKTAKKKPKKRAKYIYDDIHEKYFDKYIENTNFSDIFSKREFNCVTATALFSIALDYLKISYEIKEMPTHVYLVVYPENEKILFETTAPQEGSLKISDKQIENYKKYLIANKLITEEEAKEENFFNNHYFVDSTINLKQLIGIQYYNNSIKYVEADDLKTALFQMEKAFRYHDKPYIKEWITVNLITLTDLPDKDHSYISYCNLLAKIYNYNAGTDFIEDNLIQFFYTKSEEISKKTKGDAILVQLNTCLSEKIANEKIKSEFHHITHLFVAEKLYLALDMDGALSHLLQIYQPEEKDLNLFVKDCLIRKFGSISNARNGIDSLQKYEEIFPFVRKDPNLQGMKIWCYMKIIYTHFELNEDQEGMIYMDIFKNSYQPSDKVLFDETSIGQGFGAASAFYVRKNDYEKAKDFLRQGLKYAPDCLELKRKLKYLDDM